MQAVTPSVVALFSLLHAKKNLWLYIHTGVLMTDGSKP